MNRSTAEIEADIAATRRELAGTLDALGEKLDVKSQARKTARDHKVALLAAGSALVVAAAALVWRRQR